MSRLRVRLLDGVLILIVGCVLAGAPFAAYLNLRSTHQRDLADIALLRQALDSTQAAARLATTPADSLRLATEIRARAEGLARREYHVPQRAAGLERWWRPGGAPTVLVSIGVLLILGGGFVLFRYYGARAAPPN